MNTPEIDASWSAETSAEIEPQFNIRDWLRRAIEQAGGTFTGGSVGEGGADLDFTLEGMKFHVQVKFR